MGRRVAFYCCLVSTVLLCSPLILFGNTIDALKSDQQVNAFLHSEEVGLADYSIRSLKTTYADTNEWKVAEVLGVKTWSKADIDHDGVIDLFVLATMTDRSFSEQLVIMDHNGRFDVAKRNRNKNYWPSYPVVQKIKGLDCIVTSWECEYCSYKFERHTSVLDGDTIYYESVTKPWLHDTLIFAYGGLIEANFNVVQHHIESIIYSTEMCYGTCPVYGLAIDSVLNLTYNPRAFNKRRDSLTTRMTKPAYDSIVDLLNYLNFPELREDYAVNWTDDTGCTLIITYDGGKVKKIHDYGELGTNGLILLYKQFSRMHTQLDSN